jgi:hypothetical protein
MQWHCSRRGVLWPARIALRAQITVALVYAEADIASGDEPRDRRYRSIPPASAAALTAAERADGKALSSCPSHRLSMSPGQATFSNFMVLLDDFRTRTTARSQPHAFVVCASWLRRSTGEPAGLAGGGHGKWLRRYAIAAGGFEPETSRPDTFARKIRLEVGKWGSAMRAANLKVE